MTMTKEVAVKTKLKIKFGAKRVEAEYGTKSCEFGPNMTLNNKWDRDSSVKEHRSPGINKKDAFVTQSCVGGKVLTTDPAKVKPSMSGANKRGPPEVLLDQNQKRRRIDRSLTQQCSSILKKLMTQPAGWIFNHPVDPVELNIPDYFSIISKPMDLGTIKTKLEKNVYCSTAQFAADVRLTFSNAMLYNPPSNGVHKIAKELNDIFDRAWKSSEAKAKRNYESSEVSQGTTLNKRESKANGTKKSCHNAPPLHSASLPKRSLSVAEKQKLKKELQAILKGKVPPQLHGHLQRFGLICQNKEKTEVDIDAFDDESLWELRKVIRSFIDSRAAEVSAAEVELAKSAQTCGSNFLKKSFHKGTDSDSRHTSATANTKTSVVPASLKCGLCGGITCQCNADNGAMLKKSFHKGTDSDSRHTSATANTKTLVGPASLKCGLCGSIMCQCNADNGAIHESSSELSSDRSLSRGHRVEHGNAPKTSARQKTPPYHRVANTSQNSKSDPDSDGTTTSTVDNENICPSSHLRTESHTAATSREEWNTQSFDIQLSPTKALRAAYLKSRFADTILKAQQKTLLVHGDKTDSVNMRQQKERLERKQHEEKARIEAIKAAEAASRMKAEVESKMQRDREREAARIALQEMEKTVEIDENIQTLKDLEVLTGYTLISFSPCIGSPLERLGLFVKEEYLGEDEDELILNGDGVEEGEIC